MYPVSDTVFVNSFSCYVQCKLIC